MNLGTLTKVATMIAGAVSVSMGTALARQSAAVSVPAQFQGDWRVKLTECPPTITDRPVWINANHIRLDHSVGQVRVVEVSDKRNVTIAGKLLSEGDPRDAKLRLKLSSSESKLTISEGNWSVELQRCPMV